MNLTLRKVTITQQLSHAAYEGRDLLDGSIVQVVITGKLRMNYIKLALGAEVYVVATDQASKTGRLVIEKYICLGHPQSDLCQQKHRIDEALERLSNDKQTPFS